MSILTLRDWCDCSPGSTSADCNALAQALESEHPHPRLRPQRQQATLSVAQGKVSENLEAALRRLVSVARCVTGLIARCKSMLHKSQVSATLQRISRQDVDALQLENDAERLCVLGRPPPRRRPSRRKVLCRNVRSWAISRAPSLAAQQTLPYSSTTLRRSGLKGLIALSTLQ